LAGKRIGLREVRALKPGETVWDGAVAGFGVRRQRSAVASYVLIYRTLEGRQRWQTIGRHGSPWTPETARAEAQRLLGKVKKGEDPAAAKRTKRQAATVSQLCDLYLADAQAGRLLTRRKVPKKSTTLEIDRGRIERHIKPLLGRLKVTAVTADDVDGDGPMKGFRKLWNKILQLGEFAIDVTPNVLRHSFTSLGADLGYSDITIGAIVGHKGRTTTSRYIHSADAVLLSTADAAADQTAALMSGTKRSIEVIPFRREFA
jgi:integrase